MSSSAPTRYPPTFDPRQVPVLHGAEGLAAAPAGRLTPEGLRERFARPPVWTPELVRERRFTDRAPAPAAVLIPLVVRERLGLLLTQRTAHLSTHSGQIAFPGGKVDAEDRDATAAALREAQEEIGLEPAHVEVLGRLPEYVTGTQFHITPVVALVQPGFTLLPNPGEVDDVFEVPLDFLMDPVNHRRHGFEWNGEMREWYSMPYQEGATERFIWGATAGMLRNLYRFLTA
ncbi:MULTISPECIES: CoA pyrophosphatase [Hydrogenophaga]|jgi:8-oxo-dGTP pyrophosphatase MutT (NUDIX family)|uniref:CoA pyrophosphatase n=1 Tax=Hydrogenophaga TaxID=47420 RepID=UPI0008268DAC|nr:MULTISPECIES: CoA pyrophosphatase [Hydrogenophaga]OPF64229.1 coenzyme A pyrophosphatase [Hydrogenophaga sp. H7]